MLCGFCSIILDVHRAVGRQEWLFTTGLNKLQQHGFQKSRQNCHSYYVKFHFYVPIYWDVAAEAGLVFVV